MGTFFAIATFIILYGLFAMNWRKKEHEEREARAAEERKSRREERSKPKDAANPSKNPKNPQEAKEKKKGGGIKGFFSNLFWAGIAALLLWGSFMLDLKIDESTMWLIRAVIIGFGVWKLLKIFKP